MTVILLFSNTCDTCGWAIWHRTWDEMDINMQFWKNYSFFSLLKILIFNLTKINIIFIKDLN